jgi:hypothetical protein
VPRFAHFLKDRFYVGEAVYECGPPADRGEKATRLAAKVPWVQQFGYLASRRGLPFEIAMVRTKMVPIRWGWAELKVVSSPGDFC